jgi:hypothetical protein
MRECGRDSAGFEFGTEHSSYEYFGSIKSNEILISSVTGGPFKEQQANWMCFGTQYYTSAMCIV